MPTKTFALRSGEEKRLRVAWGFGWKNLRVELDGREIGRVDKGFAALRQGQKMALEDGSNLLVQVAMVKGPFGKVAELHLYVDGKVVPGSDAVPIPKWGYAFMAACGAIPLAALGGAVPAALGFGAAAGCASLARDDARSTKTRVALCALVTAAAWVAFLTFAGLVAAAR